MILEEIPKTMYFSKFSNWFICILQFEKHSHLEMRGFLVLLQTGLWDIYSFACDDWGPYLNLFPGGEMHMLRMELQNGDTEGLKEDFGQDILGQMEA